MPEDKAIPVETLAPGSGAARPLESTVALPTDEPTIPIPVESVAVNPFQSPEQNDELQRSLTTLSQTFRRITGEVAKLFVGQEELVTGTLVALYSAGHVLIESVPGLGKTIFVRALGKVLGCDGGRIQFTPDLMPADITGSPVFDMKSQEFRFRRGPVFTQFLLADEINRSPAKTHAALLESMQECAVTVDNQTYPLPRPFFVLATQNPIESEGTYHLPEAEIDRFMFKLVIDYPTAEQEAAILRRHGRTTPPETKLDSLTPVTSAEEILRASEVINEIYVADPIVAYINSIVRRTRSYPQLSLGASTRAGLALMQGARTMAAFHGRTFVIPDDILQLALPSLRHRVTLTPEAEIEGQSVDAVLSRLVRSIEIPRT
ncbi:MAG: MoxR family ATPase [Planctomycetia bacterium]|nr:MoxR family ATPase [Planctomycetia bacterium]